MGTIIEMFTRWNTARKLNRGRCEWCETILPDVHPIPNYQACSEECARELWATYAA